MRHSFYAIILSLFVIASFYQCSDPRTPTSPDDGLAVSACVTCHTDAAKLKVLAIPEEGSTEDAGES
ncbi:MAG: hypothetical protein DWQ05_22055 [Calditrichaeota bacterium]|nr:MAG: hypothetical protein DWQ05_22055 [Calditrichota bacterium]